MPTTSDSFETLIRERSKLSTFCMLVRTPLSPISAMASLWPLATVTCLPLAERTLSSLVCLFTKWLLAPLSNMARSIPLSMDLSAVPLASRADMQCVLFER